VAPAAPNILISSLQVNRDRSTKKEWSDLRLDVSNGHEPFIALEQWKASRHRSQWLVVSNRDVANRDSFWTHAQSSK